MGASMAKGERGEKGGDPVCDEQCIGKIVTKLKEDPHVQDVLSQTRLSTQYCDTDNVFFERFNDNNLNGVMKDIANEHPFHLRACTRCRSGYVPLNVDSGLITTNPPANFVGGTCCQKTLSDIVDRNV